MDAAPQPPSTEARARRYLASVAPALPDDDGATGWQRHRHREPRVVVGVLTDQVYPPGCGYDESGLLAELIGKT